LGAGGWLGGTEGSGRLPLCLGAVGALRIAEKQGRKDAGLEYGERAYRGYQALGGNDRAIAELTRAIRVAKELWGS